MLFYFNEPATTEIYTLSLHDALPIFFKVMDVIPWPRKRIYRHRNGAYFGSTKKRSDEFRGIGKHDENAVAARDPQFKKSISDAVCKLCEFRIAHRARLTNDGCLVRMPGGRSVQEELSNVELRRNVRRQKGIRGSGRHI